MATATTTPTRSAGRTCASTPKSARSTRRIRHSPRWATSRRSRPLPAAGGPAETHPATRSQQTRPPSRDAGSLDSRCSQGAPPNAHPGAAPRARERRQPQRQGIAPPRGRRRASLRQPAPRAQRICAIERARRRRRTARLRRVPLRGAVSEGRVPCACRCRPTCAWCRRRSPSRTRSTFLF